MNDVSRSFRGNSNAARDIAHHLHPYTNFKKHEADRPAHHRARPRRLRHGRRRQGIYRGHGRPVVGGAGLQQRAAGDGGLRADEAAAVLSRLQPALPRARHQPRREAEGDGAGRDVEGVLRQLRLRGQRHRHQDGVVHEQCAGPAAEEEDRLAHQGLSRRHRGGGEPDRPAHQPPLLRPADRRHPAHELPALLPLRPGRRERGAVRHALRRGARGADHQGRRRRPGRRHDLRAGDGRRRRDRAAQGLLREDPGGVPQVRHAVHRRRGDLRLRPHRQRLGLPDDEHQARHPDLRQGAVGVVPADLGGDGERRRSTRR